jgi:hypothetical protein
MHHHIAEIRQDPFGLPVALHTERHLAALLHLKRHFIADRLDLFPAGAGADDEKVGEG